MAKYLLSRLLLVFFCKFFCSWAFNVKSQLVQFFDFKEGFGLTSLSYFSMFSIIALGIFTINLLFTIIHISEGISIDEFIKKIRNKGFLKSAKYFINDFWSLLSHNFQIEATLDKYPNLFIVFALFFLPFLKGNPILNNYYGIYAEYQNVDMDGKQTNNIEKQNYIVHKSKSDEISVRMTHLEEKNNEDEPYFEVKKRGYLFIQAGLIDGYRTYYKGYKGFVSYTECLFFSVLEKLINTIMYFLIPFLICIALYHYKFENK